MGKISGNPLKPRFPIYVPSKGRWESRLTIKALERCDVAYRVVVEKQEYNQYANVVSPEKILVLPFRDKGLVAARNWIWEYSIKEGFPRHWQLDDNIDGLYRLYENKKYKLVGGRSANAAFRCIEDFVERYENVAHAGMQYFMFAPRRQRAEPLLFNTRIYSCHLIMNSLPFRFRSFYNDDTDFSLQLLKAGWCTVLFNAFLILKQRTMTVKGGNTPVYQGDGRLKMAQALRELHPDVTEIKWKWGRWQHQVDYRKFKRNKLRLKPGVVVPDEPNEYGMKLPV